MNIKDLYRHQFDMGQYYLREMVKEMSHEEMVTPPVPGGNYALWSLGHITFSEASGLYVQLRQEPNPLEAWEALFDQGTTPTAGGQGYPGKDEVWSHFEQVRRDLLAFLEAQSEEDLDKPSGVDHPWYDTAGKMLGVLAVHQAFHAGQIALARKALGKPPALF